MIILDNLDHYSLYDSFKLVLRYHYYRAHSLLDRIDIYPGQPPLLFALNAHDGLTQKELADKLKIQPATMTMMIKRMEKSGFIERKVDEKDQRKYNVFLTVKGKEKYKQVKELMDQIDQECFNNFSDEEKVIMRRLFLQMYHNLALSIDQSKCERMDMHD